MKGIDIKNLRYRYPDGTLAIDDISLNIKGAKKIAILGSNGSGKSTLLQHLNGLILPQQGSISINGNKITKENLRDIRKTVGYVFDNPDDQLFSTTVYEDIAFGPRNLLYDEDKVARVLEYVMDLVGVKELEDKQPHNLSLGQKRKVAIAGVLAMEPEIMILDEPFSGLDPKSLNQFLKIFDKLHKLGHTVIVTTHDVDIAYEWADEFIMLNKGKLINHGNITSLEDRELIAKANLNLPTIYEIFEEFDLKIRSKEQARAYIKILINK